jgi:hypothetical protein
LSAPPDKGAPQKADAVPDSLTNGVVNAEWRARVRQSAIELDADAVIELAGEIQTRQPELARQLVELAEGYDYPAVITLMDEEHTTS